MFINEVVSKPRFVEGRKFIDRTIKSKFKKAEVTITTTYMNDKPLLKKYIFDSPSFQKQVWKSIRTNKISILV